MAERWYMRGALVGACNCDWGCPCNFDAPPTYGNCDGIYCVHVRDGRYGDVSLDGLKFLYGGHSPGAIHEGGGTGLLVVDEAASDEQRGAIETLVRGDGVGGPFEIFASVTETFLPTVIAPIEIDLDGMRSSVRADGVYELAASRIKNPVTGDEEELYLDKPTGITSTHTELGMSTVARLTTSALSFDTSGKYAEYAEIDWSGP